MAPLLPLSPMLEAALRRLQSRISARPPAVEVRSYIHSRNIYLGTGPGSIRISFHPSGVFLYPDVIECVQNHTAIMFRYTAEGLLHVQGVLGIPLEKMNPCHGNDRGVCIEQIFSKELWPPEVFPDLRKLAEQALKP